MKPGMIPILHWPGAINPGQFGPINLVLFCVLFRISFQYILDNDSNRLEKLRDSYHVMLGYALRNCKKCQIYVYRQRGSDLLQTTSPIPAATASSMPAAAKGGGMNRSDGEVVSMISRQNRTWTYSIRICFLDSVGDSRKDRSVEVSLPCLAWINNLS